MIEELSKEFNMEKSEVEKIWNKVAAKYKSVRIPKDQLEKTIRKTVSDYFKKDEAPGYDVFFGIPLMLSQPRDGVQKRRKKALEKYHTDTAKAVKEGYVAEISGSHMKTLSKDGSVIMSEIPKNYSDFIIQIDQNKSVILLDNREKWDNGKNNFAYLKPIPAHSYFSIIEGIFINDEERKWFRMTYNLDDEYIDAFPLGKVVKFKAKTREHNSDGFCKLNSTQKMIKFEIVDTDPTDYNDVIQSFYESIDLDLLKVDKEHPYDIYSVEGNVSQVWKKESTADNPHPWNTILLSDLSRDDPLKIMCHPCLPINFIEGSFVKVWGTLSLGKKWNPDTRELTSEEEISMFSSGIFPLMSMEIDTDDDTVDEWES